jgi:hypothetical protein
MKQYLIIHPVGQGSALLFGLFNLISGLTRKAFNRIIHINCGLLYYFMVTIGILLGRTATSWATKQGIYLKMQLHMWTGSIIIILFVIGAITGFILFKNTMANKNILKLHRWANIINICLFLLQIITGIKELLNVS